MPAEGKKNYDVIPPLTSHFAKKRSLTNRLLTQIQMQTFAHFFCSIYTSWRNNSPIFIVTLQQLSKQQL